MKELSTQEIVKRDPEVRESGTDWRKVYVAMAQTIEANTHRVVRVYNTLFWLKLLPNDQVTYTILTADPPNRAPKIMEEFQKVLKSAGLQVAGRA
jgi:hypothetical protein